MDPKLRKLQAKWYKKLAKTGFVDIEHDEMNLKQFSGKTSISDEQGRDKTDSWRRQGKLTNIADHWKFNYYSQCREFLLNHVFSSKTEHGMFEMHTEGLGVRVIAKKFKTNKNKVNMVIRELVKVMRGR